MKRENKEDKLSAPAAPLASDVATMKVLGALGSLELFTPRLLESDTELTQRAADASRHRTIAHLIIAVFLVSLVFAAGQCFLYYRVAPTEDLRHTVLSLYGLAYLYAGLALFSFKFLHRSTSKLSNSYAGFALIMTFGVHTLTGLTLASPIVPLYFFIPAWAFLTCSSRAGIGWSMIVAGVFIGVTAIGGFQFDFPDIIPADYVAGFRLGTGLGTLVLIGICLYVHQGSFLAVTQQLDEDMQAFAHKATHDPLTGLANREQFDLRLQAALDGVDANRHYAALIYIDLNGFKAVNDTHGHQMGDQVLRIMAQRIDQAVRESDTTARLGGDEFGIVLPQLKDRNIVRRIVKQLEETLSQPMSIDDVSLTLSGAVGMAIAPDDGFTASSLTRHADRNMYNAKSRKSRLALVQAG